MSEIWRLLDTGLQSPGPNMALARALLEARHANEIPTTLRFGRSTPCVLVGFSDVIEQLVDVGFCYEHNIPIYRQFTAGAAAYIDEQQLICELYLHCTDLDTPDLRALTKRICHAAATAVAALGVDARHRSRGEIEVDGRAVGSAACARDGGAILCQATLTMHSAAGALRALRVAGGELGKAATEAAYARATNLRDVLGGRLDVGQLKHNLTEALESEFDVEFREGDLSLSEQARCQAALQLVESSALTALLPRADADIRVLEATHRYDGAAVLRVLLTYDALRQVVRQVWFSVDGVKHSRTILDLEAALRDVAIARLDDRIRWFFASRPLHSGMPAADDFATVLRRALEQPFLTRNS